MRCCIALLVASVVTGCGGAGDARPAAAPAVEGGDSSETGGAGTDAPVADAPGGRMLREGAQRYALALVNRDRAKEGLPPVRWDETAARAAAKHAEDIATNGFTAHLGTDGSVPELRYSRAGGTGLVMENVGCFADAVTRAVDPGATFSAGSVDKVESSFMNEKPPHDGHRRNILAVHHTSVGIAVIGTKNLDFACVVQEFVDDYGTFFALPTRAKVGATIRVAGELRQPAKVEGIGISRVDKAKAQKPEELNLKGGYAIPKPYVTYFGKGFKTPKPVDIHGNKFFIDVPLSEGGRPGLYGVSVWATFPGSHELEMVSLRVVEVE